MIEVGVVDIWEAHVSDVIATIFALRTHVPEDEVVDYKYVVGNTEDKIFIATEDISLTTKDLYKIQRAIPTGTTVTLDRGTQVLVWSYEV